MTLNQEIRLALYAQTHVGMVRRGNEDNFLVVDLSTAATWTASHNGAPPNDLLSFPEGYYGALVAVSDGMGGALAGEVASSYAVKIVRDRMLDYHHIQPLKDLPFHERLRLAIEEANVFIHQESIRNPQYAGMGATFTAAGVTGDILYLAQIGDSRAYLIRNGRIAQLTKDQSLVGTLVEAGQITEEEAQTHAYRNVILQALGASSTINVDVRKISLRQADILLLCSDGLSGKVRASEMLEIVAQAPTLKDACDQLIDLANERGGEDNITVAIIQFTGNGLRESIPDEGFPIETIARDANLPTDLSSLSQPSESTRVTQPLDGKLEEKPQEEMEEPEGPPEEQLKKMDLTITGVFRAPVLPDSFPMSPPQPASQSEPPRPAANPQPQSAIPTAPLKTTKPMAGSYASTAPTAEFPQPAPAKKSHRSALILTLIIILLLLGGVWVYFNYFRPV